MLSHRVKSNYKSSFFCNSVYFGVGSLACCCICRKYGFLQSFPNYGKRQGNVLVSAPFTCIFCRLCNFVFCTSLCIGKVGYQKNCIPCLHYIFPCAYNRNRSIYTCNPSGCITQLFYTCIQSGSIYKSSKLYGTNGICFYNRMDAEFLPYILHISVYNLNAYRQNL